MKNNKSPFYLPIFLTTIACWNAQLFSSVENFVPNSAVVQTSPDRLKFDKTVFATVKHFQTITPGKTPSLSMHSSNLLCFTSLRSPFNFSTLFSSQTFSLSRYF